MLRRGVQFGRTLKTLSGWNADIVVTPPTWRVRFVRWLMAVTLLSIVYQAYALAVVPLIEPGPGAAPKGSDAVAPSEDDTHPELAGLFPEGSWERGRPMVLSTQWGKLLFREYRPGSDGRLELVPCTIVFYVPTGSKDNPDARRAVILQAPDKAVLSFSGPLNFTQAEAAKLKGARLEGEVKIWSRETKPGANDALSITTRNVQILPQQIWTAHDVAFAYGPNHGTGRDLSITIGQTNDESAPGVKDSLVKHLEAMELSRVEEITLQVPNQGLLGDAMPDAEQHIALAATATPATAATTEVDVTCQGPFRLDFRQSVASLEDHVEITHDNPNLPSDQLACDQLLIHFQSASLATDAGQTAPAAPADSHSAVQKVAVRRIEARGMPATLRLPSMKALARSQQLSYDFETRRVLLIDDQNALLSYGPHEVEAPRLEYELHAEPKRLGRLWATGPGTYEGQLDDDPEKRLTARWSGVLELQPQEGLHVLSIVQGADFSWSQMGTFAADELYVWLAEVPVPDTSVEHATAPAAAPEMQLLPPAVAPAATPSEAAAAQPPRTRFEVRPVKMLAQGNVHADSPQFQGKTPRLEVWFDHPQPTTPASNAAGGATPASTATGAVTPPPDGTPQPPVPALPAPKDTDKKLELTGDWMRLRLGMIPQQRPKVNEATVVGNVRLSQLSTKPDELPLLITGEMLQLRTDALDRSAVDVNGTPACVHVQGMLLEGTNLHLSQRENRLEAEGPGRMKVPTKGKFSLPGVLPAAAAPPAPATDAAAAVPNTPIWINWQGGMEFDGQVVRFVRQVEVRGIHTNAKGDRQHVKAIGDQLHATLNRYVVFEKTKNSADLDLAELRFIGDVFTEIQTFNAEDVGTSHDRLKLRDLLVDRQTGRFHAAGPGWIMSTRQDTENLSASLPGNTLPGSTAIAGARNAPAERPGATRLIYLRVDYQNEIEGNIDNREAVLQHYVRVVYGPVQSWDQTLDPDQRGGLGPKGIIMTCQRLFVTETGEDPNRGVELSAVGETLVEGTTFTAQAQRFTYIQAKDQLILDGGNELVRLQKQERPGESPKKCAARQIKYWVNTGEIEVHGAMELDFNHMGSPDVPKARIR